MRRIHTIIAVHAALAGAVGAGLAPIPGSDAPVLTTIQVSMISALAETMEVPHTRAQVLELAMTLSATVLGRNVAALVIGRIPVLGWAANAATAAAVTEAMGYAAVRWFDEHR